MKRHRVPSHLLALAAAALLAPPALQAQSANTLFQPVLVPLHWRHIDGSTANPRKLGIYAAIGDGQSPEIFEFDTGGAGFYATYSPTAPWWGTAWSCLSSPCASFSQNYDSGLSYTGSVVSGTVQLFDSATASQPRLTATGVTLGQTSSITENSTILWPSPSPPPGCPGPTECAFYGDFGMALKPGKGGINSLVNQLSYGPAVTPGFRVHAADESPWVQFGLGKEDLALLPTSFSLNLSTGELAGGLMVSDGRSSFSAPSPLTDLLFDTGAFTTLHIEGCPSQFQPPPLNPTFPPLFPDGLAAQQCSQVRDGAAVVVSGLTLQPGGAEVPFLQFAAGDRTDVNKVALQTSGDYYLNTGILPFRSYDLIYNLDPTAPRLTLVPQQVPAPAALLAAAGAWRWGRTLRRRSRLR